MAIEIRTDYGTVSNFINNKHVASSSAETAPIYSPYTGEEIGKVPMGGSADVDQAVAAAKAAFPIWSGTHIKNRVQVMFKLKTLLEKHFDELTNLVCVENGKTWGEAKADVAKAIELIEFGCSVPNMISGGSQEVSTGITCSTTRVPLGVVASITPFNFPVMVPMWTIPIAITSGNTMVIKASEQVPLSMMRLAELMAEAGLPAGVLNVVNGGVDSVNAICDHPDIAAVSFVGSTKVAKIVYGRAAGTGKRVLALGGAKNHLILVPDADIRTAPSQIVDSAIGCAGQRCMAASTMIAVGDCSEHIAEMKKYAESRKLGADMGAIINAQSVKRITGYLDQAVIDGATLLVDGRNASPEANGTNDGFWVGPTIIDNVTADSPAGCEEIFGPTLSIIHVDTLEEAMAVENANPYGNACSIFTTSGAKADYVLKNASAGMCGVNIGVPVPREPFAFGGWNDSKFGVGDITGEAGINFWTKDKKMTVKWIEPANRNWMS